MNTFKCGFVIFAAFLLVLLMSTNSESVWITDEGEEDIVLLRVDTSDPDAPLQEMNEGVYGFWKDGELEIVLDFNASPIIQPPYDWDDVYWSPNPLYDKPGE